MTLIRPSPWVIRSPRRTCHCPIEDECGSALRMGCGEKDAHRTSLREAQQSRAFRSNRIQHCADVVHPLLKRWNSANPVREASTSLVKADQPAKGGQALKKAYWPRILQLELQMGNETRHQNEIERPVPHHLVGDVDVATL